jgi:MoaA/NifB/PqqE/SkfB family radical SAM enzyme
MPNNLDHIYQELGEDICLYPFFGAFYQTNNVIPVNQESKPNSVRPCSIVMAEDWAKWDITDNNIHAARNNLAWQQMRQDFIDGRFHEIFDCRSCSYNEKSGTTSPRQANNKFLAQFLDIDIVGEVKNIMKDNRVTDIITLDYYPSNYCNYSCIMCAGGASSQRQVYEVKVLKQASRIVINSPDPDFYQALSKVQVINFTGGETALQKQVHQIMDYLIEQDLAKNILITLLTNASSSASELMDKFRKFKQVIYNVSIDGTGEVIEYQRRGAVWTDVVTNSLELLFHESISTVVNYVLTAVNALSAMDFIDWAYQHGIGPKLPEHVEGSYINVSPVFRVDHLGVAALPAELRKIALERLYLGRKQFNNDTVFDQYYRDLVDRFISVIEATPHNPEYLPEFIRHIQLEDTVSKKPLSAVVPEWAPYFD